MLILIGTNTVVANDKTSKNNLALISELKQVKELFDTGVIDEKEFKLIKQKLINKLSGSNLDSDNSKTNESAVTTDDESLESDEPKSEYWGKKYYQKAKEFYDIKDYENAYKWAKKSADKNYKGGFFGLGLVYEKGYGGADKNIPKAIKMYKKAANLGHVGARGKVKRLTNKSNSSKQGGAISDVRYSCVGDVWEFGATGGSSNSSESYWKYPEVKDGVLTVPEFGTYTFRGKKDKALYWKRTEGKDRKKNWAKIDLGGGESLITKKDTYAVLQFKGKCSVKN